MSDVSLEKRLMSKEEFVKRFMGEHDFNIPLFGKSAKVSDIPRYLYDTIQEKGIVMLDKEELRVSASRIRSKITRMKQVRAGSIYTPMQERAMILALEWVLKELVEPEG